MKAQQFDLGNKYLQASNKLTDLFDWLEGDCPFAELTEGAFDFV